MKKILLVVLACLSFSCGPPGVVVCEKIGSQWRVKEVHFAVEHVNEETIEDCQNYLNENSK